MPPYDFRTPRLFVDTPLAAGAEVLLERNQANYLFNVLRVKRGDGVLVFNGRDGEWQASHAGTGKRAASPTVGVRARAAPRAIFAVCALKHARLDYMVHRSWVRPTAVITQHTQLRASISIGCAATSSRAAQQCGVLSLPHVADAIPFDQVGK
jgi:16S rRNA (uracil1498-N3)-methyltransferase